MLAEDIPLQPLLRPSQVEEAEQEIIAIEASLGAPRNKMEQLLKAQRQIDPRELQENARSIKRTLDTQRPPKIKPDAMKAAVALEKTMRERIVQDMPTQQEMRLAPSGAVEKHLDFERRHGTDIQRLKNLRLMLQASGHDFKDGRQTGDNVCNLETFRPHGASHQLDLNSHTVVDRKAYFVGANIGGRNLMDPEEAAAVRQEAIDLSEALKIKDPEKKAQRLAELLADRARRDLERLATLESQAQG